MRHFIAVCFLFCLTMACQSEKKEKALSIGAFQKTDENPILKADSSFTFVDPITKDTVRWQRADVFNPAAIVKNDSVYLLYRCEDNPAAIIGGRTSRLGLAVSADGIHFTKFSNPVLYPDSSAFMQYDYPGGCEDPRLVQSADGKYVVVYTSWNGKTARLSIAVSDDLFYWEKKGPAFAKAYNGQFLDTWSKSGSIVTKFENGKQVAAKINGKYWMYWGEKFVNLASSDDLINWIPELDDTSGLKRVIEIRSGKFDSDLTECGPPALVLGDSIVLFYNGKNAQNENADTSLPQGTYSVGKVVFDAKDPSKVLYRTDSCLLKPSLAHEMTGQYKAGTTFSEGLVLFHDKWFLYYGTADSFVGLAVADTE